MHRRHVVRGHAPDYALLICSVLLLVCGMIIIYSISPALSYRLLGEVGENYFLLRQAFHTLLALIIFTVVAKVPYQNLANYLKWLILASGAAIIMLQIPGIAITENGATRWIGLGPISFQPAELMKLTVVIYMAQLLAKAHKEGRLNKSADGLIPTAVVLATLGILIVILQKDMGTMLVVTAILLGMFFISGVRLLHVGYLTLGTAGAALFAVLLAPHRMSRLLTFIDSSADIQGAGYHINQALIAIGSGGITGLGLGRSVQVYGYLPEAANDSIFAILAEKFGLIGGVIILSVFMFLLYRIYRVVLHAPNMFARLLSGGILLWIASHIIINIGSMLSLMPLTGITLPFLSYGGSSLLFIMMGLGIVFNISRYTKEERGVYESNFGRRWNSWTHHTTTSSR